MIVSRTLMFASLFVLLACASSFAFNSADSLRATIRAVRIDGDIELTGKLSDPRWNAAQPVDVGIEIMPGENIPAPARASVCIVYNSEYVYFGFRCDDPDPSAIRAHITDRDKMFDDDFVGIILDTYGDFQRSFEFMVNPYGIQADLLRVGNNEDPSFDTVWKTAADINASGWTAEMAIPFKSLRFPSIREQKWVALFFRNFPRGSRHQISWTPTDRNNPCFVCQGGFVTGIADVQSVTSVDILPYIIGKQSGSLADVSDPTTQFQNGKIIGQVGGSIRYSPSPDLAIEAVVNPDFSQVETDATQISINSPFALNYPEKRPFFVFGSEMFQNMIGTFYSRMINNPIGAARILGKSGSFSFSYLAAGDRNTPYLVPGEEGSDFVTTNLESFSNIARARYDFGNETFFGGMVTTRNTATAHNYVGGIDWNYKFTDSYSLAGQITYSDTREINDTTLNADPRRFGDTGHDVAFNGEQYGGAAYQFMLRRDAREYSASLTYMDRSPVFQAQDGFVPNTDTRMAFFQNQYSFYPSGGLVDQWSLQANAGLHFNHEDVRKEKWFVPGVDILLKAQTEVTVTYFMVNDELFGGTQFNNINRTQVNISAKPDGSLSLIFNGSFGRFIRRSDNPEMGTGHTIDFTAQLRPTSRLQLEVSYSRSRLASVAHGTLFYDGYIAHLLGIYQFTPELYLRIIGQYDQFNRAIEFYPLLSYKLNPFTIFYAGSTYSMSNFGDPFGVKQTARQYFLKLQYLLRS